MKILHVTPYYEPDFQFGGVVRSTSVLCRELVALGHEVTVYTTAAPGRADPPPLHRPIDIGGVRVVYFRNVLRGFGFDARMLAAARRVGEFDVVHSAAFWQLFSLPVLVAAIRKGVATVSSPRGSLVMVHEKSRRSLKHRLLYWLVNHPLLARVSALHFTAELERDDARPLAIGTPSFKAPNPMPVQTLAALPPRSEARERLGLAEDRPVLLFLGRLDRRKALDVLVRALAEVRESVPDVLLILAGPDYGEETMLRGLIARLGLTEAVRFTGLVNDAERADLFAAADLLTLTSLGENFGNAAGEALSVGLPVVASDKAGSAEYLEAYGAGRVVRVDAGEIAAALVDLLGQREKLPEMGRAGQRLAREKYDAPVVARVTARAYLDILEGVRSPECEWAD